MKRQIIIAFAAAILSACQNSTPVAVVTVTPTGTALPVRSTETLTPTADAYWELEDILTKWEQSAHANTYDLSKGPNTYCARCHSPKNWDPQSKIDAAPNCVSCKLASEDSPRMALNNPLVVEDAWEDIGCDICHARIDGRVSGEIAWWNQTTQTHEEIVDSNDLCQKCHENTEVLEHRIDLGERLHQGSSCIDCHDAHSTEASCTNEGCHAGIVELTDFPPATPVGVHTEGSNAFCAASNCHPAATAVATQPRSVHGYIHSSVSCVACHAAGEVHIGPSSESGLWVTWRSLDLYGLYWEQPYASHNLQVEVDCLRCHSDDSPWGLPTVSGNELKK